MKCSCKEVCKFQRLLSVHCIQFALQDMTEKHFLKMICHLEYVSSGSACPSVHPVIALNSKAKTWPHISGAAECMPTDLGGRAYGSVFGAWSPALRSWANHWAVNIVEKKKLEAPITRRQTPEQPGSTIDKPTDKITFEDKITFARFLAWCASHMGSLATVIKFPKVIVRKIG